MSIQYLPHLDPMVEMNFTLERCFGQSPDIPNSVPALCESLSQKYSIPMEELTALLAPVQAMEKELYELLDGQTPPLEPFCQPESAQDCRLVWAFFHLLRDGGSQDLGDVDVLRRLVTLTLNCEPELPPEIRDFDSLMQFLTVYPCSRQTKWVCSQLWRQPQQYLDQYLRLLDLCTPVIQRHSAILQPDYDAALSRVQQAFSSGAQDYLHQIGFQRIDVESLVVCPSAGFFSGISLVWDQLTPGNPVHFLPGIYHHQLGQLVRRYSDNTEYLSDRLKAISDKRRLDIIKLLKSGPLCGQDLAEHIGLSPATISHHMNSLVTAGFISMDKQGTRVSYSVNQKYVDAFLQNLGNTLG